MAANLPMPAGLRAALAVIAVALYVLACAHLTATRPASPWTLLLVLGPMTGAILAGLWRAGLRWLAAFLALLAGALLVQALRGEAFAPEPLYLAQHAGMHLALAVWFAATLRPGDVPLITRLARRLHPLTPAMAGYARRSTVAWVAYFLAMTLASLALYRWASFPVWTVFANVVTPLAVLLMFVGEFLLRYRLHPEFERVSFGSAWRAWQQEEARLAAPGTAAHADERAPATVHPAGPTGSAG